MVRMAENLSGNEVSVQIQSAGCYTKVDNAWKSTEL